MRKKHLCSAILSVCATSFFLSSCIDKDYDLNKDIDLTIQVGGDLTVPGCNTEEITLKKIFDLDEGDPDNVIKADANGYYALSKEGAGSDSDVKVDAVKTKKKDINTTQIDVDLTFPKYALDQQGIAESLVEDEKSSFTMENNEVTKDIVKIVYADTNPDDMMPISIVLSFQGDNNVKVLYLDDFKIQMPKFLGVELNTNDAAYKIDDNNMLTFTGKAIRESEGGKLTIPLLMSRIDFNKEKMEDKGAGLIIGKNQGLIIEDGAEYNRLNITGTIIVNGNTSIKSSDFGSGWQPTADVNLMLNTKVELGKTSATPDDYILTISKVRGVVDPKIDVTVDPVSFDNLPDFLSDNEVVMDLTNPKILLTVANTAPVDVNIYGNLVATKDNNITAKVGIGSGPTEAYKTEPILIKANATTQICLSRLGEGAPVDGINVKVEKLNDLIKKIPDNISMENIVAKALQQEYDIELGKTFFVSTSYNVDAPLAFGADLNIIYNDTINDWNKDIADNGIEIKEVNVVIDALNKIPLNLKLTALPIDVNAGVIPESQIKVEQPAEITPGNGLLGSEIGEQSSTLTIKLTTVKEGAMQRLDGLLLRVEATNKDFKDYQGIQLNENQTLKLDNIRIKIPGGVKANFN